MPDILRRPVSIQPASIYEHWTIRDQAAAGNLAQVVPPPRTSRGRGLEAEIVSVHPLREEVRTEIKLPVRTAREIAGQSPANPSWIVRGYVVTGGITEVDGRIKASGKTTFITHMCRKVLEGAPFLGMPTTKTGVLYLSEQPDGSLVQALRRADLLERDDFAVVSWHEARNFKWPELAARAAKEARDRGAGLLVVDVFSSFSGISGEGENNAGDAVRAMEPLKMAVGAGDLAVVIARHERKGGGEVGESGRGSSAFAGDVDVILSLRRPEGAAGPNVRMLHSLSRFDETPPKLAIELTDNGYRALGDEDGYLLAGAKQQLLEMLASNEMGAQSISELKAALKAITETTIKRALQALIDEGAISRRGLGRRGDPHLYWRPEGRG